MSAVNITNVAVLDNPTAFLNPFQFEISYECLVPLDDGDIGLWGWALLPLQHGVRRDVEYEKEDDNKLEDEMHEDEENQFEEEDGSFSPQLMHGNEDEDAIDPEEDKAELDQKREAVVLEHQRKVQEAMKAKARVPDEMEMKAIKTMGAMEEGDAVFGAGAEVNLD
ncbi:unnamed protein product [Miscanthus lutarioriparius]|uniref:Uncharacterized protein n=1 Tax=Miscanthus lutarioriparius TaxID=422564 RepID=A0A811RPW4_9POAL|nr:unnamed protein product [Miscanthus lutarioriparius]